MFQCKQEERELKRMESDVIKNERNLKKMLQDYESGKNGHLQFFESPVVTFILILDLVISFSLFSGYFLNMQIKYAQSKSFELKYTKAIYVLFGS